MDVAFEALRERARSLPLRPSEGEWGPFEVLSHIAGWHQMTAGRLQQIARGEEADTPPGEDEANAGFVAQRRGLTAEALVADVESTFLALREAVSQVPAGEFWRGAPGEEDSLAYFITAANTFEHYPEHQEHLKAQ
jgi:hypothetical protein